MTHYSENDVEKGSSANQNLSSSSLEHRSKKVDTLCIVRQLNRPSNGLVLAVQIAIQFLLASLSTVGRAYICLKYLKKINHSLLTARMLLGHFHKDR